MKLFLDIKQITAEELTSATGVGAWGLRMDPAAGEVVSWECPMGLSTGGVSTDFQTLTMLLSFYAAERLELLDPSEGPDNIVITLNGEFYLYTITVE